MAKQKSMTESGLSAEAQAVYERLSREWTIKDGAGALTLLTLCQSLDRLRQAQAILAKDGITTTDRWGQQKIHPATQVEREARAGLLACLKVLNLDLESLEADNAAKA